MLPHDRFDDIALALNENGHLSVRWLCQRLHVSEATMRRDLRRMEDLGLLRRTHGGAMPSSGGISLPLAVRNQAGVSAKELVAQKAFQLIREDSTVLICSSSTSQFLAKQFYERQRVTVVTNSVPVLQRMIQLRINAYFVGGWVDPYAESAHGQYAIDFLNKMHFDMVFFVSAALSDAGELSGNSESGVFFTRTALARSTKRVFMCIGDKFNSESTHRVCSLFDVDVCVCDVQLPAHLQEMVGRNRPAR